jgi:hypothetical protein
MAAARASVVTGVVGQLDVNSMTPLTPTKLHDPSTGGWWCAVWFLVAIVILWIIL